MPYDFASTCLPHRAALYARALRLTNSRDDAEDLVQETLIRTMNVWPRFRVAPSKGVSATALAWMNSILLNLFISSARMHTRHRELIQRYVSEPELHKQPEHFSLAVQEAIFQLSPARREILIRRVLGDETYDEIADALCMNQKTVGTNLWRAKRDLKACLAERKATL